MSSGPSSMDPFDREIRHPRALAVAQDLIASVNFVVPLVLIGIPFGEVCDFDTSTRSFFQR